MAHARFVPLRIFSAFTMLDGAIDPKAIAKHARKLGFPAAAITDRNGLYGAMAFSDAAKKDGVQPIIGAMLGLARPGTPKDKPAVLDWIALYAQDAAGYDNLCALDGRIVLANEHASRLPGWQEGSVLSAMDAIGRLHAKVVNS